MSKLYKQVFNYLTCMSKINIFKLVKFNILVGKMENCCLSGLSLFLDTEDIKYWANSSLPAKDSYFGKGVVVVIVVVVIAVV